MLGGSYPGAFIPAEGDTFAATSHFKLCRGGLVVVGVPTLEQWQDVVGVLERLLAELRRYGIDHYGLPLPAPRHRRRGRPSGPDYIMDIYHEDGEDCRDPS
jgi:hypothetical protein